MFYSLTDALAVVIDQSKKRGFGPYDAARQRIARTLFLLLYKGYCAARNELAQASKKRNC
jgi:hypothetical protein